MTTVRIIERFHELRAAWSTAVGVPVEPATELSITDFERLNRCSLPASVRLYFLTVNGMHAGTWDTHYIRFWPLGEVRSVAEELPEDDPAAYTDYFVFADYSIWAHAYAVNLRDGVGQVVLVGGARPTPVAATFADFLELYFNDPDRLFPTIAADDEVS